MDPNHNSEFLKWWFVIKRGITMARINRMEVTVLFNKELILNNEVLIVIFPLFPSFYLPQIFILTFLIIPKLFCWLYQVVYTTGSLRDKIQTCTCDGVYKILGQSCNKSCSLHWQLFANACLSLSVTKRTFYILICL